MKPCTLMISQGDKERGNTLYRPTIVADNLISGDKGIPNKVTIDIQGSDQKLNGVEPVFDFKALKEDTAGHDFC